MIDAALKYIADLATKAASPQKVESGNPRAITYAVNGDLCRLDLLPSPRKHTVGQITDLIELANRFGSMEDPTPRPVVWYDESAVVLVIDDDGHRLETVTFPLVTSDVFDRLRAIARGKEKFEQKAFVRLLRIDLAGTLDPVMLLEKVRRVKFENGVQTVGSVAKQRESFGRSITSEVSTDGGDLPDEVTLSVPVYKTMGQREAYPLRCSVEVDPGEGTFRLLPLPDELERVGHVAVSSIARDLSEGLDSSVPAYYGKP